MNELVGNIPYEGTEQQLVELFSSVGQVVAFRLVTERDTGKPKGYGFCEFKDPEVAKSAIRNLNGAEFMGRALRVDASGEDNKEAASSATAPLPPPSGNMAEEEPSLFAQHPIAQDALVQIIAALKDEEKVEVLSQMKILAQQNPEGARELLVQNPQLAQAILHLQASFGLVQAQDLSAAVKREPAAPFTGPPQAMADPYRMRPMPMRGPPPPPNAPMPSLSHLPPDQQELLGQVLKMTPAQIATLPPEVQAQVQMLKAVSCLCASRLTLTISESRYVSTRRPSKSSTSSS